MPRILTPAQLAICCVLFFLPWIEVQCAVPDFGGLVNEGKAGAAKPAPKAPTWSPLLTQTGYQAATGEYTMQDPTMKAMMEMGQKAAKEAGEKPAKDDDIKPAPLLFVYLGAVGLGAVMGLVLPAGGARKALLIVICAAALGTVGGQAAIGFPVKKSMSEGGKKDQNEGFGGPKANPDEVLRVLYKWPLYLSFALVVGAALTTLLEAGPPKPKAKSAPEESDEPEPDAPNEPPAGAPPG